MLLSHIKSCRGHDSQFTVVREADELTDFLVTSFIRRRLLSNKSTASSRLVLSNVQDIYKLKNVTKKGNKNHNEERFSRDSGKTTHRIRLDQ